MSLIISIEWDIFLQNYVKYTRLNWNFTKLEDCKQSKWWISMMAKEGGGYCKDFGRKKKKWFDLNRDEWLSDEINNEGLSAKELENLGHCFGVDGLHKIRWVFAGDYNFNVIINESLIIHLLKVYFKLMTAKYISHVPTHLNKMERVYHS